MYKPFFKLFPLPIALMFAILAGCGNLSQVAQPVNNGQGIALLKIAAAAGGPFQKLAKKATLTISASDMLTMTKSLTITDSSVEGTITGIPAGKSRVFSVSVFDSLDTLQYQGSATANVIADSTVKVSINVDRITGNAIVNGNIIDTTTGGVWQTKKNMPIALATSGIAVLDSFIYLVGGDSQITPGVGGISINNVLKYNPQSDTWDTSSASLPISLEGIGCAVVNNKIYSIGGSKNGGSIYSSVYEYNPALNTWATKTSMPTARTAFGCVMVNNLIYAIDGVDNGGHNVMEMFNPLNNSWVTKASDIYGRGNVAAAFCSGKIYALGGSPSIYATNEVSEYDTSLNSWSSKAPIPISVNSTSAVTINNSIYLIGGNTNNMVLTDAVYKFDPSTNTWKEMQSKMPVVLCSYSSVAYKNLIYIFGGIDHTGKCYKNVMVYNPSLDN